MSCSCDRCSCDVDGERYEREQADDILRHDLRNEIDSLQTEIESLREQIRELQEMVGNGA